MEKLAIGSVSLDKLLGGGVELGTLTEFYGEAGSGKTNICLQLTRNVVLQGKRVLFVDTEGVSTERLEQICGKDADKVVKEVLFFRPYTLREQEKAVEDAVRLAMGDANVGLIVLDSATTYYRVEMGCGDDNLLRRSLGRQLTNMLRAARDKNLAAVITNQVYTDIQTDCHEPMGGHMINHNAKAIIKLEKTGETGIRRATIKKHRHLADEDWVEFNITGKGVE